MRSPPRRVLVMGEAAEGCPAALVRGLAWTGAGEARLGACCAQDPRTCSGEHDGARELRPEEGWREPADYVALSGGVGGAKLSLGLAHLLGDRLTIIVNTGR